MPVKAVTVKLFKVQAHNPVGFLEACGIIKRALPDMTIRPISNYASMKMDQFNDGSVRRDGCYYMDFCRMQKMGPGKTSSESKTQPIRLEEHEDFGFLTAVLYHEPSEYILVEYNHQGAKPKNIADYIGDCGGGNFEFVRHVNRDVKDLLKRDSKARSINYTVALTTTPLGEQDKKLHTTNSAVDLAQETNIQGVGTVEITIKASPQGEDLANIHDLASEFIGDNEALKKARIKLRSPDGDLQVIDFLEGVPTECSQKLEYEPEDRLHDFHKRCGLLYAALLKWQAEGIIAP